MPSRKTALITGASSGIGEAFAGVFAAEGFDLVITARREDRLRAVADTLRERHGTRVHVLPADLSERDGPARLCDQLAARGLTIDALVNSAGYGISGTFMASEWQRHAAQLQVMTIALAELTYRLLPGMIERGHGRVINVASLAALVPAPAGHTLYAACRDGPRKRTVRPALVSRVAERPDLVVKFSEALANEVRPSGVHVTALCPGFTRSEFHDVTGTRATVRHLPDWLWMDAPTVARQGFDAAASGTTVHVPGRVNRTIALLARHLPRRVLVAIGRRTAWRYRRS